jgi:hypothetical protein
MSPVVLQCGKCERLKAATHSAALGIAAVCAVYNFSAWLVRRQQHLAINAVVYSVAVMWEAEHVRHHLAACAIEQSRSQSLPTADADTLPAAS